MRRSRVLRGVTAACTVGVIAVMAVAGIPAAGKPVPVPEGRAEATLDAGFAPKALSRTKLTPIALEISGDIVAEELRPPPPLRKFLLEGDKNLAVDVKGLPICDANRLRSLNTALAESACRSAIVGRGHITMSVGLPGDQSLPFEGKAVIFNGGIKGRVTSLHIHAYLAAPVPETIVFTVKIKKINKGRYGLLVAATIPEIFEGDGFVSHLDLEISKRGVLAAKCVGDKLRYRATAKFTEARSLSVRATRRCISLP